MSVVGPKCHLVRCKDMSGVEVKADSKANAELVEVDPFRKWSMRRNGRRSIRVTLLEDLVIGREQAGRDGEHRVCSSSDMLDELPWSILLLVDPPL
jgi:hypothetical protein